MYDILYIYITIIIYHEKSQLNTLVWGLLTLAQLLLCFTISQHTEHATEHATSLAWSLLSVHKSLHETA